MVKDIKNKIIITLIITLGVALLYLSGMGCIYRYFIGIPCPGCGITRAVFCLLKLDFKGAFDYNYMVYSLPLLYAMFLTDGKLFKEKLLNYIILSAIFAGFTIRYILLFI